MSAPREESAFRDFDSGEAQGGEQRDKQQTSDFQFLQGSLRGLSGGDIGSSGQGSFPGMPMRGPDESHGSNNAYNSGTSTINRHFTFSDRRPRSDHAQGRMSPEYSGPNGDSSRVGGTFQNSSVSNRACGDASYDELSKGWITTEPTMASQQIRPAFATNRLPPTQNQRTPPSHFNRTVPMNFRRRSESNSGLADVNRAFVYKSAAGRGEGTPIRTYRVNPQMAMGRLNPQMSMGRDNPQMAMSRNNGCAFPPGYSRPLHPMSPMNQMSMRTMTNYGYAQGGGMMDMGQGMAGAAEPYYYVVKGEDSNACCLQNGMSALMSKCASPCSGGSSPAVSPYPYIVKGPAPYHSYAPYPNEHRFDLFKKLTLKVGTCLDDVVNLCADTLGASLKKFHHNNEVNLHDLYPFYNPDPEYARPERPTLRTGNRMIDNINNALDATTLDKHKTLPKPNFRIPVPKTEETGFVVVDGVNKILDNLLNDPLSYRNYDYYHQNANAMDSNHSVSIN